MSFLGYYSLLTALSTGLLLIAGALVTGTHSGLSVPDWPLSYGTLFPEMVGGVFFEHGHRLIAGFVGLLTLGLAVLSFRSDPVSWRRRLSYFALATVVFQAVLGGLTVIYKLPIQISVLHATTAQVFFSAIVVIATSHTKLWKFIPFGDQEFVHACAKIRPATYFVVFLVFLQVVFGATTRHLGAGLAIPDFPLSFGQIIPKFISFDVLVHFLHRAGALLMFLCSLGVLIFWWTRTNFVSMQTMAGFLISCVLTQGILGALIIWMKRPVPLTTLHLLFGGLTVAASVLLGVSCLLSTKKSGQ